MSVKVRQSNAGTDSEDTASEYVPLSQNKLIEIYRTYPQCLWLYTKVLANHPSHLLPPLPDRPLASDPDYLEKKRLQMERFMQKLFARRDIVRDDRDVKYFMSPTMSNLDAVEERPQVVATSFLSFARSDVQQGFRIFHPSNVIESRQDQDAFEMRKRYVLTWEALFTSVLSSFSRLIKAKEASGKALQQIAYAFKEHQLGEDLPPPFAAFKETIYDFATTFRKSQQLETRDEVLYFGDVILEMKNSMPMVKHLMNHKTEQLIALTDAMKHRVRVAEQKQKLKSKGATEGSAELAVVAEEEQKADNKVQECQKAWDGIKESVTTEMTRFERDKTRELKSIFVRYAGIQLQYEREKLDAIAKCLRQLNGIQESGGAIQ